MDNFELEPIEIDYTLLGNRVESIIELILPTFIIKWFHNNECGCDKRKEWLNNKHLDYREWRIKKATSNYNKARAKLDKLIKLWG